MVMWQVHGSEGTTPTILYVNKNFWSSIRDGGPPEAAGQAQSTFLCFHMKKWCNFSAGRAQAGSWAYFC